MKILSFFILILFSAWANPVVLVTGGAGYIGSHTCKALAEAGFTPVAFDSLDQGKRELVQWGPLVVGDLLDAEALDQVFLQYRPIAVFHFAGLRNVADSVKNPSAYYTNNVSGSIHLLNAMKKHQVRHLIFSSSCTVYGNCSLPLISEEQPKFPLNPYARSKFFIEQIIKDYADSYPLSYMILRYFNAAGVEKGLSRSADSFLIPQAILALLHPEQPFRLFGVDYPTPDGTCIRDYIHVKDLARAHVLALQHLLKGNLSEEMNLGSGVGYSVLEILQVIEQISGQKVPCKIEPRRPGDASQAVAQIEKAKNILQFYPIHSQIEEIIRSEWESVP